MSDKLAPAQRLYTVNEAADILGMGRSTLYRLVKSGRVSYRLMPTGKVRFVDADIKQIIEDAHRPAVA